MSASRNPWPQGTPIAAMTPTRLPSTSDLLTDREIEVLRHLQLRRKPKEIAQLLCVSEATVRTHIRNAIRDLGVHGSRSAVRVAYQLHLLDSAEGIERSNPEDLA